MGHLKGEVGASMTTFRITKDMKKNAGSGAYKLLKEERNVVFKIFVQERDYF